MMVLLKTLLGHVEFWRAEGGMPLNEEGPKGYELEIHAVMSVPGLSTADPFFSLYRSTKGLGTRTASEPEP